MSPEPPGSDGELLCRRRFLRVGAGALLVPGIAVGAGRARADAAREIVLRAGRFTAAPDGRRREVWGYNGQLPGPEVRAKEGDTLRVRLVNGLGVPTTIHWHGMHQPGTWRMDGVDGVSGPPVAPGSEFVYEFRATPAGTHWYHSHVGVQYGNGLFGPLVVEERTPPAAYDREATLLLNDWFLKPGDALLAALLKPGEMRMAQDSDEGPGASRLRWSAKKDVGDLPFESALFNGKGRAPGKSSPRTVLEVKQGERLRLRLINGSSTYAFRFQIDNHRLTVIAADGAPVRPFGVTNLVFGPGERYDVLLRADDDTNWIRAATLDGKEARAVLRYAGGAPAEPAETPVRWGARLLKPEDLHSLEPADLPANPKEIEVRLGGSMRPYRWSINDRYYPDADPVVLDKGEPVRFVFRNRTAMDHPFHLHGHYFHVLGRPGALNLKDPPRKDTVIVPARRDLAIQWRATNPGRWFFHCHIEWHLATGMARVIEIRPF